MPQIQATAAEVQAEFDLACHLLAEHWNLHFPKPHLLLGNDHVRQYTEINSLRDLVRANQIHGLYDSETNSVVLPNDLLNNEPSWDMSDPKTYRTAVLLHEGVHAALDHINPKLDDANLKRLRGSDRKEYQRRGWAYAVFHEGMACYLSIGASITSGNEALCDLGHEAKQSLTEGFTDWVMGPGVEQMAQAWGTDPNDYRTTLLVYFGKSPGLLALFQYLVGYYFVRSIEPNPKTLERYILNPPRTVRELIYPEEYLDRII